MPDPEFICLSCDKTYVEDELYMCPNCSGYLCPGCGGEISTFEKYDEAMKANAD